MKPMDEAPSALSGRPKSSRLREVSTGSQQPWILVTNDDGADSPALAPLLRELGTLAPVRCLVPAEECSWTSKIVSRFAPLRQEETQINGLRIQTLTGYPADCANIGINNLTSTKPALVVSGVNVGTNAGLAYFLSSGTVGAAIEGMLNGVPAAAFSMQIESAAYASWRQHRDLSSMADAWQQAAVVTREIVGELLRDGLPQGASLLTVNMPPQTTAATPRVLTKLTSTRYGAVFVRDEQTGEYRHSFSGLLPGEGTDGSGDMSAIEAGNVALTPIQFALDVEPSAWDRRRFERQS